MYLIFTIFIYLVLSVINPSIVKAAACDAASPPPGSGCCNVDIAPDKNYCVSNSGCEHIDASNSILNSQGCLSQWNYVTQSYACERGQTGSLRTCTVDDNNTITNRPCCRVEVSSDPTRNGLTNCYGEAGTVVETNTCPA